MGGRTSPCCINVPVWQSCKSADHLEITVTDDSSNDSRPTDYGDKKYRGLSFLEMTYGDLFE